ncbi:hypothetical protein D3C80_1369840 [compost metagenome]
MQRLQSYRPFRRIARYPQQLQRLAFLVKRRRQLGQLFDIEQMIRPSILPGRKPQNILACCNCITYISFLQLISCHYLSDPFTQGVFICLKRNSQLSAAVLQPIQMAPQQKRDPSISTESFKQAHAVQKAVIQSGNHGVFGLDYSFIQSDIVHAGSPALRFRKLRSMVWP